MMLLLATLLLVATQDPAGANPRKEKPAVVVLAVRPEKGEWKPGQILKVAFDLDIPKTWHIYPAGKKPLLGNPTVFTFENAEVAGKIEEPPPTIQNVPGMGDIDFHEGKVTITVPLKIGAAGQTQLRGTLKYQISDPNVTVDHETPLTVPLAVAVAAPVVMTEELMARLIKLCMEDKTGSLGKQISKVLELNDGTQNMPMKSLIGDSKDGDHFFGVRPEPGSKDVIFAVRRPGLMEVYLTDRTGKLRAAAVSTDGNTRLIPNEKSLDKFNAELAMWARESSEQLPPTASGSRHQQWHGLAEGDLNYATRSLKTNDAWAGLWAELKRPMPRKLDDHEMAVFIAIGERPTGGFYPLVLSATELGQQLVVVYTDGKPPADALVSQGRTLPWVLAIVPKSDLPLAAREQAPR